MTNGMATERGALLSLGQVARRIGVKESGLRWLVARGVVAPPRHTLATQRAYTLPEAEAIEAAYHERVAAGKTRGPHTKERRARSQRWLAQHRRPAGSP